MTDAISIRELLWEWGRAYPKSDASAIGYPRVAAFGREMQSGHRESSPTVDQRRADHTDKVVECWLQVMKPRAHVDAVKEELAVFWLRYNGRWEQLDVARRLEMSQTKVRDYCKAIEARIEVIYLQQAQEAA